MKNLSKNLRNWTVSIGDDKVLDTMGDWGTTQDALNFYNSPDEIDDLYTEEEARQKARELNEEEELTYSLIKYQAIKLS